MSVAVFLSLLLVVCFFKARWVSIVVFLGLLLVVCLFQGEVDEYCCLSGSSVCCMSFLRRGG